MIQNCKRKKYWPYDKVWSILLPRPDLRSFWLWSRRFQSEKSINPKWISQQLTSTHREPVEIALGFTADSVL